MHWMKKWTGEATGARGATGAGATIVGVGVEAGVAVGATTVEVAAGVGAGATTAETGGEPRVQERHGAAQEA